MTATQCEDEKVNFITNNEFARENEGIIRAILKRCRIDTISEISVAPDDLDKNHATDFVVTTRWGCTAARVRREHIPWRDFTVRSYVNGGWTELDKLKRGDVDLYIYAWHTAGGGYDYMVLDMARVVRSGILSMKWPTKMNTDGTKFICISTDSLILHDCVLNAKGIKGWEKPQTLQTKLDGL